MMPHARLELKRMSYAAYRLSGNPVRPACACRAAKGSCRSLWGAWEQLQASNVAGNSSAEPGINFELWKE
jgi:hypothetical protein